MVCISMMQYDVNMRTTVDLPAAVHRRALEIAQAKGQSLSATVAELVAQGLARVSEPSTVSTNDVSGFPQISLGHPITRAQVGDLLDEA